MKVDYRKMILTTALFTLAVIVVVGIIIALLMVFVFTKQSADFFYNLGSEGIASTLYHKVYEQNGDIYYCYKSLNLEIKMGNDNNVITYYEEFTSDDEYDTFMDKLKVSNEILTAGVLEKSVILNEENYLTNKYISSLISSSQSDKAFNYAINEFANYEDYSLSEQGVYALYHFVGDMSGDNIDKFTTKYNGFEEKLYIELQNYFDMSLILFNNTNSSADLNSLSKAYLVSLGNRLITVGQNLNAIYTKLDTSQDIADSNLDKMQGINTVIKGLI